MLAPHLVDEDRRLAALRRYGILDTPPEAEFDDFTQLAAHICRAPMALITLIDAHRQWFKSKIGSLGGAAPGLAERETPRELAFCTHALGQKELLEVTDAKQDERFRGHPNVTGAPYLRFYAGAPLVTPDGQTLGTLCVLDRRPRRLTAAQRQALAGLARMVMNQLELRRIHQRELETNERLDEIVTRRTRELRDSDERFRLLVTGVKDYAIIMLDVDGHVISWNAGAERFKGYTAEEIQGEHFSVFYPPEDVASGRPWEGLRIAAAEGRFEQEGWRVRKGGERFWAAVLITALRDEHGTLRGFAKVTRDVTERRRADLALAESEERFRQLAEHSSEGFWFVGVAPRRVLYVNAAMETILGLPMAELRQDAFAWRKVVHPEDLPRLEAALEELYSGRRDKVEIEFRVQRLGEVRWLRDSGAAVRDAEGRVVRAGGILRDITERKEAESRRLRTQRLESMGTLAGGIAHDLNNALAPILMGLELLRMHYPDETEIIDTIETSARHGAGMVRQLLTFAKGAEGESIVLQPLHLLRDIHSLIQSTFPKRITVCPRFSKELAMVTGDATQLHQVLLNLCVNARDAMPQGGTLTLEADHWTCSPEKAAELPGAKPGRYVVWRVKDTGMGIPPEVLDRIFEPFFTTKGPEKGTGLGLSTVLGIVRSHGGFLQVESQVGHGSCFSVFLPVTEDQSPPAPAGGAGEGGPRGEGELILVVDDDTATRKVLRSALRARGYTVVTAVDGADGLVRAAEHRQSIRALVTDLHMPRMTGTQFAWLFRRMLPDAGVIVCSGHWDEEEARELQGLDRCIRLGKPCSQEQLLMSLREVLRRTPAEPPDG